MPIEMCCPRCFARFAAAPDSLGEEALTHLFPDVPCGALGDGETFEDMISAALYSHAASPCPSCGEGLRVSEESLGQLALTMLARM
jgi:hypothetical protein